MSLETDDERIVGVLHGVVEDGPGWTFERLEEEGFSPTVLDALRLVTKRLEGEGDSEAVYVALFRPVPDGGYQHLRRTGRERVGCAGPGLWKANQHCQR